MLIRDYVGVWVRVCVKEREIRETEAERGERERIEHTRAGTLSSNPMCN